MAYERISDSDLKGEGLDVFVEGALKMYDRQLAIRNAADETRFNTLVLEQNLPLDDQLAFRKAQLERAKDDPTEKKRLQGEVSALTNRIEAKKYSDEYTQKLLDFSAGISNIDTLIDWLKTRRAQTTDSDIRDSIDKSLLTYEAKRFELQKQILQNQTDYAVKDKTASILKTQIDKVSASRNQALLSGNQDLVTNLDLQLQSLQQAAGQTSIESTIKDFSVATMAGYQSATALLDAYNGKMASAPDTGPVTIGGVKYNSAKEFWTYSRDKYLADDSDSGFFGRVAKENKEVLATKYSNNLLTSDDIRQAASKVDALAGRNELQPYTQKINATRQDIVQTGVDYRAAAIENTYARKNDVNSAFTQLEELKNIGGNVDKAQTEILSAAAQLKQTQVSNILDTAQKIMKDNPGTTPEQALNQALSSGAGQVLSPEQLTTKTEKQIVEETARGSAAGSFVSDPRTTLEKKEEVTAGAPVAPIVPTIQDLGSKYGIVGNTVYRKSDNYAFKNEAEFFADSGLSSFQNVKFDTAYKPPVPAASPQLQATPETPKPVTYKVLKGDTLSAIAQKYLGDAKRYQEIAKLNKITNPNVINVGQEIILPKK